mmetsp:Transcript_11636/g.43118  ORF Transcript_11636/g.43118 Transcript_11636/m.43118 type:complete len:82 (-) Transcript_11636:49-294(-)
MSSTAQRASSESPLRRADSKRVAADIVSFYGSARRASFQIGCDFREDTVVTSSTTTVTLEARTYGNVSERKTHKPVVFVQK